MKIRIVQASELDPSDLTASGTIARLEARERRRPTYCREAGVSYRHCGDDDEPEPGETIWDFKSYCHRPEAQTDYPRRVAVLGGRPEFLELLNHWNRQPESGWSYYA